MRHHFVALTALVLMLCGCATQRGFPPQHGIPNLDRVDEHVWRGGQPNRLGLEYLRSQGVRTVLNLSMPSETWPGEAEACAALGLRYVANPLPGFSAPTRAQVDTALDVLRTRGPVFVHCAHGCDRTGTIIACYRIENGWPNAVALKEAEAYGISHWEPGMRQFIRTFQP